MKTLQQPAQETVYNADGSLAGLASWNRYRCQMSGCTGQRVPVKWPDGQVTRPCSKGLFSRPDGAFQIG